MWSFGARTIISWLGSVGFCIVLIIIVNSHQIRIAYHKSAMQSAQAAIYSKTRLIDGFHAVGDQESYDRYEYHRNKLVMLGYLAHISFTCAHLTVPTEESKHFSRSLVEGDCPLHIDFSSPYTNLPTAMELNVWCLPEYSLQWKAFIATHDVPDYRARFMAHRVNNSNVVK